MLCMIWWWLFFCNFLSSNYGVITNFNYDCCCYYWLTFFVCWFVLTFYWAKVIIVPHRIIWSWYTGRWSMDCYIWYSEERTGRGRSPPRPLLAVPNVTVHPPTASVPITILLYNGPLSCGFNVAVKEKKASRWNWTVIDFVLLLYIRPIVTVRTSLVLGEVFLM